MLIYIVEDDENISEIESYVLENGGFETKVFPEGESFLKATEKEKPDLVLLDIMLPGQDGISILKTMRKQENLKDIPVILVTAKTSEIDRVKGLDVGADDYITKPFGTMELLSRVKALLRRTVRPEPQGNVLLYDKIAMFDNKHKVEVSSRECILTYKEYELLRYLLKNKGIVLSRDKIMESVWGFDFAGESRTVDMHIKTLRQKLGDQGEAIKTIRNVGYKLGE